MNLTAEQVVLRAATGIGSGDALETQTAELDAINTTGSMEITNTSSVTLSNLVTQGDINFINTGNVTLDMRISNGSVLGVNRDFRTAADITANNTLIDVSGDFGTPFRPKCGVPKAYGCFHHAKPVNIEIHKGVVDDFEKSSASHTDKNKSGKAVYVAGATLLHELCHWGNYNNVPKIPELKEMGAEFEKVTYGKILY